MNGRIGISFLGERPLREYADLARLVDRYPFATVSVYEDLFYQPAWPALFQFALHTRDPILGPSVVNPYLGHPVTIAANLAVLDRASGGRAYLGVGKGAFFEPVGVPQPRPLRAIRELVEMVQRLLAGDRRPFRGEFFRADEQGYLRFPVLRKRVPILIGTWGEKTAALAGQIADMLKVGGCVNARSAPVYRRYLEAGARRAGRDAREIRLLFGSTTVVDEDRKAAEALARRRVAMYIAVVGRLDPTYAPPEAEISAVEKAMSVGDVEGAARALSEESLRRFCCFGTPEDVVRQLEDLFAAGVDLFELGAPHGIDEAHGIRLIGERVLPAFRTR